jgi:hypothetical protein
MEKVQKPNHCKHNIASLECLEMTNIYSCYISASRRLSDLIRQPYDLYRAGVLDEYFMGLMNQVAQAMDDSVTQEVQQPNLNGH